MIEGKGNKRIPNFKFGLGGKLQYEYYEGQYYKFVQYLREGEGIG